MKNQDVTVDESHRTCGECAADCAPEVLETGGQPRIAFCCPAHGLHDYVSLV